MLGHVTGLPPRLGREHRADGQLAPVVTGDAAEPRQVGGLAAPGEGGRQSHARPQVAPTVRGETLDRRGHLLGPRSLDEPDRPSDALIDGPREVPRVPLPRVRLRGLLPAEPARHVEVGEIEAVPVDREPAHRRVEA